MLETILLWSGLQERRYGVFEEIIMDSRLQKLKRLIKMLQKVAGVS